MKNLIKKYFNNYGFSINDNQINQFYLYFNFLIEENKKYNLTAITEPTDVFIKHFIDSVLPINYIKKNATVIDIGTGAGFPGVPIKILRPDIKLTLVDSLQKRINFLNILLDKLKIYDVITFHARAEEYITKNRESFDVVISRAVASIPTLTEYLLPFVKINGIVLMYKGNKLEEELSLGQKAISLLGGKIEKIEHYNLKEVESERNILIIKKINHTNNKFPRGKNLPKTNPII